MFAIGDLPPDREPVGEILPTVAILVQCHQLGKVAVEGYEADSIEYFPLGQCLVFLSGFSW